MVVKVFRHIISPETVSVMNSTAEEMPGSPTAGSPPLSFRSRINKLACKDDANVITSGITLRHPSPGKDEESMEVAVEEEEIAEEKIAVSSPMGL